MARLTRTELIALVEQLFSCRGTPAQENEWITALEQNVPHPAITDLMYWSDEELSPAQIVDRALAYKPIPLPASSNDDA